MLQTTDLANGDAARECASRVAARCGLLIDPSLRCPLRRSRRLFPGFALARSASPASPVLRNLRERRSPDACRIAPYLLRGARRGSRPPEREQSNRRSAEHQSAASPAAYVAHPTTSRGHNPLLAPARSVHRAKMRVNGVKWTSLPGSPFREAARGRVDVRSPTRGQRDR